MHARTCPSTCTSTHSHSSPKRAFPTRAGTLLVIPRVTPHVTWSHPAGASLFKHYLRLCFCFYLSAGTGSKQREGSWRGAEPTLFSEQSITHQDRQQTLGICGPDTCHLSSVVAPVTRENSSKEEGWENTVSVYAAQTVRGAPSLSPWTGIILSHVHVLPLRLRAGHFYPYCVEDIVACRGQVQGPRSQRGNDAKHRCLATPCIFNETELELNPVLLTTLYTSLCLAGEPSRPGSRAPLGE